MKIAFVFPGQGSQAVGMMEGFAAHPVVRETFAEASEALGEDLWALVESGPQDAARAHHEHAAGDADCGRGARGARGRRRAGRACAWSRATASASTRRSSPPARSRSAMPCRSCAFARRRCRKPCPRDRARWPRSWAATTAASCPRAPRPRKGRCVEAVNFNAPGQVVIAGHKEAVERAIGLAKQKGAKRGVMLPVSAPFHSTLLRPAADQLAERLAQDRDRARRRFRSSTTSTSRSIASPTAIREALARQAANPVHWTATDPRDGRPRRHARRRMRARQGARRPDQAHRGRRCRRMR